MTVVGGITALLLAVGLALPQQAPPDPTFHAGTELVQVSVVARDKQGKPVADLQRDEFRLFDNGEPQVVRVFVVETDQSIAEAAEDKPRNTFTNRIAPPSGAHSGYSVILIDNLYTDADPTHEEGSTVARLRTLQMLRSMPAGEKIAIYAAGRKLQVVCEFSSDHGLIERQLRQWKPSPDTPENANRPLRQGAIPLDAMAGVVPMAGGAGPVVGMGQGSALPPPRGDAPAEAARIDQAARAAAGDWEMEQIADHLAGVPGRKNLIWLSNRFTIGGRALQKLAGAGLAVYPVDLDGVCRLCPERPVALMENIAALTGGVAYYKRNDLDVAIRDAIDDGRVSYSLGFYADDHGAPFHRLAVQVSRPDILLRYRASYEKVGNTAPAAGNSLPDLAAADLVKALNRPIDATEIPIRASVTRTRDQLMVDAALGVESLGLSPDNGFWKGTVRMVGRFITADGLFASDAFTQTLALSLQQPTFEAAMRDGLTFRSDLKVPSKAVELKLLFASPASGKIGTITIPLSKVVTAKER